MHPACMPSVSAVRSQQTMEFALSSSVYPLLQEAAKQCKLILRSDPNDFHALLRLGVAKRKSGANEVRLLPCVYASLSMAKHAMTCSVSAGHGVLLLAQEALVALNKALRQQPQNAFVLASLGAVKYKIGSHEVSDSVAAQATPAVAL